jgi:hypothetical protein
MKLPDNSLWGILRRFGNNDCSILTSFLLINKINENITKSPILGEDFISVTYYYLWYKFMYMFVE